MKSRINKKQLIALWLTAAIFILLTSFFVLDLKQLNAKIRKEEVYKFWAKMRESMLERQGERRKSIKGEELEALNSIIDREIKTKEDFFALTNKRSKYILTYVVAAISIAGLGGLLIYLLKDKKKGWF